MKKKNSKEQAIKAILAGNTTKEQAVRKLSRKNASMRLFYHFDGLFYPTVPGLSGSTSEQIHDYLKLHSIAHTLQQVDALEEDIIVIHAVKPTSR